MRSSSILAIPACFWLASYGAGLAQPVDTGRDVTVNPAAERGASTLLYPGGEYAREVPQLLYPGEKAGPIQLHMPTRRRAAARSVSRPVPKPAPAKAEPAPKVAKAAPAEQTQSGADNSGYMSFASPNNYSNIFGGGAPQPAPKPAPGPKPAPPKPAQTAKAEPAPVQTKPVQAGPAAPAEKGLTKRSVILFAKDAPDPAQAALGSIKFLAGDLNAAMTGPSARVELQAYGGTPGDKGSDARRLSLKRALAIRQILIDDGVSPDRIDVRAMGGSDDSGPADRVDVYVRA